ncbi:hypothetical protein BGP77_06955 [Saccharospirillum sp. MSK14-1]|uniref:FecR family protein n=1 Tax=Saccharospirillum sp. MSK14-1 TaxID=1897632 RepID=UPI000D35598F|nr:FecR family protein [Saccharospirillum sp. MSK14-1]PTY37016.1 hypothetical protein BGP77_06955 [Saccharospirillum sp. MSK14-1]
MNVLSSFHRIALVLALLMPAPLWAAAGKVVIATGDVFAVNAQDQRRLLQRRSDVFEGDILITGADSALQLRFEDNAILALRANSQLRISEYHGAIGGQGERVLMDLLAGGFRTISGSFGKSDRDAYQVRTPTASIGIRGTHYEAVFQSETLTVGVYEGGISVTNEFGTLDLGLDSDFLYAQVQTGNLPQGLLNPPANLNVPSTPQSDAGGENDEASDDDNESDSGNAPDNDISDLNNDDSQAPSNDPDNTTLPIPDADEISDDDFDFSAVEDGIEDQVDLQDPDSVVELSSSEINALKSDGKVTGIMVFAPTNGGIDPTPNAVPMVVHSGQTGGTNIGSFFVAYDTQTGQELDDNFYLPNLVIRTDGLAGTAGVDSGNGSDLSAQVHWEHWNEDGDDTYDIEAGDTSDFNAGVTSESFFFIQAEPTTAKLSGTSSFELCSGCYAVNGMGDLTNSTVSGSMDVNFNDLSADGSLNFLGTNDGDWNLNFNGNINGAALQASLYNSDVEGTSLNGSVTGIFTGGSNNLQFAGGFSATSDSTQEAYGVFVMDETDPSPPEN